ncbi:hypothetical protein [Maridesulfovibrio zosterae]|uniref:hypothetical protein n=1 Tax=Maridesulfovibrio zosterae TaxID=82171 RepID=UPI0004047B4F|nr:hypothetical protein [Maridesulfovibrio zosterae]
MLIQAKVDSRFLGTIQNSFYGMPDIPGPVRMFLTLLACGVALLIVCYLIRVYGLVPILFSYLKAQKKMLFSQLVKSKESVAGPSKLKIKSAGPWKASTDQDVLERLVLTRAQIDILGERSEQRTLAAVANVSGTESVDVVVSFDDVVTPSLLKSGVKVKCIFSDMLKDNKKINAFVGKVKSYSEDKGAVITRTSSFGYIRRRVFARRKVADQRYIKIKIWRLEGDDYDIDYILDNSAPEIIIDNRQNISENLKNPHVIDISKGGIAIYGKVQTGGSLISRSDKILLCMLIYMPKRKTFEPHLIYAEVRAARSAGNGMSRLSIQFLRSLKIPPRKRSTLFKGQTVMAMNLANPGNSR